MAYKLTLSNGTSLLGENGLEDGTADKITTSLSLIGKNYPGYGAFLNDNFIKLLENFAKDSAPSNPLPGQIWYDNDTKALKLNTAINNSATPVWKQLSTIIKSDSKPVDKLVATQLTPPEKITSLTKGDFWWDTGNNQLKAYTGIPTIGDAGWVTVGPLNSTTSGQVGITPIEVTDNVGNIHSIISFTLGTTVNNNRTIAIISKDDTFTPNVVINGFSTIKNGFNLNNGSNLTSVPIYNGIAEKAYSLIDFNGNAISANSFSRNDIVSVSNVAFSTTSNTIIRGGPTGGNDFSIVVDSNRDVGLYNNNSGKDLIFYANISGTPTQVFKTSATSGQLELSQPIPLTNASASSKLYVDQSLTPYLKHDGTVRLTGTLRPSANVTYDLGSSVSWFNNVYGRSFQAAYADLAERYEADAEYLPGTLVEIGGEAEITQARDDLSETVLGVISTKAAYLLNSAAGTDQTHPAVAVSGRVPVNAVGIIYKGDRLVSAGNGLARAAKKEELTPWNVVGRALENKITTTVGTVLAMVRINT